MEVDAGVVKATIAGLDAETSYRVAVRGLETGTRTAGAWQYAANLATTGKPAAVALTAPNPVEVVPGDSMVTVSWGKVTGATKFRVQWRTAAQSYTETRQAEGFYQRISGALEHSTDIEGLDNDTTYMFRVFALDGDRVGPASDEVSTTPVADPAAQPATAPQ